jgi:hypothetical protein
MGEGRGRWVLRSTDGFNLTLLKSEELRNHINITISTRKQRKKNLYKQVLKQKECRPPKILRSYTLEEGRGAARHKKTARIFN